MAVLGVSLYSAGIAILLGSVYAFKFIRIENYLTKLVLHLSAWLKIGPGKLDLQNQLPIQTTKTVPEASEYTSSWWTDEKQFQLERRAIFSKSWLFATHASRFQKPGDYRTFEIAGFSFIVILGKDKQLRAFHNVCRHRAYAVTKKESGSSTILGCRYHGWSYDTKGKLMKAPEFENVAGFDKASNGLWELKTHVREGMVFINFEVGNDEAGLEMVESEDMMKRWKIGEMKWAHEWKIEGAFNWKLAVGNFLWHDSKTNERPLWELILPASFRTEDQCLALSHTTVLRRLMSGRVLTARLLPLSTNKTLVECNIYGRISRHTRATQMELESTKNEVQLEVKRLEHQQTALTNDSGQTNHREEPRFPNGFEELRSDHWVVNQQELSEILKRHNDQERRAGREIHPAARKQNFTEEGMADDDLCKELESSLTGGDAVCGAKTKGLLDW